MSHAPGRMSKTGALAAMALSRRRPMNGESDTGGPV